MEFQKSFLPCGELYRLPVYRVSWWYNILRVRPIRRALGRRLKETRGDRLAQTAIINRAAVPFRFLVFFVLHDPAKDSAADRRKHGDSFPRLLTSPRRIPVSPGDDKVNERVRLERPPN